MRPYDKTGTCPKCGCDKVSVHWKPSTYFGKPMPCQAANCPQSEHMHRECQLCGYQRAEAPLPDA